jgi:hypothetical protein
VAPDDRPEPERTPASLATREDLRAESERLRDHMAMLLKRQERKIQGLIDAIELMKYIDSEARQHGTDAAD